MTRRSWVLVAAIGAVAVLGAGMSAVPAWAVRAAGPWGRAIAVPGLEALSKGRAAQVLSISCPSPGNCAAAGDYRDHAGRQGFVVDERNGRWGRAMEVPGLGALNTGGLAEVNEVSCPSPGNCAAGGDFLGGSSHPFVVSERNGRWGRAIEVTVLGPGQVLSVSCASAGNCEVGGDHAQGSQGFLVEERNDRWGRAIEVPGLAALKTGDAADLFSVSCGAPGNCAAGGDYMQAGGTGDFQGFVVSEKNGRWGRAIEVPGLGALNTGGGAEVDEVACASAGNCTAAGGYSGAHDSEQGFVVSERNGRWGRAIEVPGLGALNTTGLAVVLSLSCGSAGNCAVGGWYSARSTELGFVAVEKNGRWGKAIQLPGLAALSNGKGAQVFSVSCGSAGVCAAGGSYWHKKGQEGFVAEERDGHWSTAVEAPGLAALNKGGHSHVNWVSCASATSCTAVGTYSDPRGPKGFVTQSAGTRLSLELAH